MNLTADEKLVLKDLIEKELKYIKGEEARPNQPPQLLAAEAKYDHMLQELLKKLG